MHLILTTALGLICILTGLISLRKYDRLNKTSFKFGVAYIVFTAIFNFTIIWLDSQGPDNGIIISMMVYSIINFPFSIIAYANSPLIWMILIYSGLIGTIEFVLIGKLINNFTSRNDDDGNSKITSICPPKSSGKH